MKKLILALFSLLGFSHFCYAQVKVRTMIGANVSNAAWGEKDNFDNQLRYNSQEKIGVTGGIGFSIDLSKRFFLEPAISYSSLGFHSNAEYGWENYKQTFALNYLQVPFLLGYSIPSSQTTTISLFAGPYFGVILNGEIKDPKQGNYNIRFGEDEDDELKPFDMGGRFGISLDTKSGIFVRAQYAISLDNLIPQSQRYFFRNKAFSMIFGYSLSI